MPTGHEWIDAYCARVGAEPPTPEERETILAFAGLAAHASERIAAPMACWVAGRARLSLEDAVRAARELSVESGSAILLPMRVTQRWVEEAASRVSTVPEAVALVRALHRKGWRDEDLATRVLPHLPAHLRTPAGRPVARGALSGLELPEYLQCTSFVCQHLPALDDPRKEAVLEEALWNFFDGWARASGEGGTRRQVAMRTPFWPDVGNVDLEVPVNGARIWVEVKWADLPNCAWDIAKLGLAVAEGSCAAAFMIAAAPTLYWNWGTEGAEFFDPGEWDVARDVLAAYSHHWLKWKADVKTRPLSLPALIHTAVPWREPFSRKKLPAPWKGWELRVVEVHAAGEPSIDVDEERVGHERPANPR